jgi:4-hydroxy-tetrahydrodipicolinate reductase
VPDLSDLLACLDPQPVPPGLTDEHATREYRVVQWSTGTIGARALRAVIEHPHMVLAGVYVHGHDKAGRDAGELCGTASTGITATTNIDEIVELTPDCVLYMPNAIKLDEVCRLLAAGINVVTTCGAFHHPPSMDPDIRAKVQAACEQGGTSVHSTGSSPGFITEAVPLVLTSIQRKLTALEIDEYADLSQRNSPELLFDTPAGMCRSTATHRWRSLFGCRSRSSAWPRCHPRTPRIGRSTRCRTSAPLRRGSVRRWTFPR